MGECISIIVTILTFARNMAGYSIILPLIYNDQYHSMPHTKLLSVLFAALAFSAAALRKKYNVTQKVHLWLNAAGMAAITIVMFLYLRNAA